MRPVAHRHIVAMLRGLFPPPPPVDESASEGIPGHLCLGSPTNPASEALFKRRETSNGLEHLRTSYFQSRAFASSVDCPRGGDRPAFLERCLSRTPAIDLTQWNQSLLVLKESNPFTFNWQKLKKIFLESDVFFIFRVFCGLTRVIDF